MVSLRRELNPLAQPYSLPSPPSPPRPTEDGAPSRLERLEHFKQTFNGFDTVALPPPPVGGGCGGAVGGRVTWTVEVDLTGDADAEQQRRTDEAARLTWSPVSTHAGVEGWDEGEAAVVAPPRLPEVGWDEQAACAWVRKWVDDRACWCYANLDTEQLSWTWPAGVTGFDAVDPDATVPD